MISCETDTQGIDAYSAGNKFIMEFKFCFNVFCETLFPLMTGITNGIPKSMAAYVYMDQKFTNKFYHLDKTCLLHVYVCSIE